jgi:Flp pilus assembly pilin Flp
MVIAVHDCLSARVVGRKVGQSLAEYGLILAGVSVAAVVALFALGPQIRAMLDFVGANIRPS